MRFLFGSLCLLLSLFSGGAYAEDLYQDDQYRALTSDRRAHKIGDVLTVLILETSSASTSAGTRTDKSSDLGIEFLSPQSNKNYALGIGQDFDGGGRVERAGRLLGQISVAVVAIYENGDFEVTGDQEIKVNGEKQTINIRGRVRPIDIDPQNTIVSSRIAEAKITYVGNGVLAESQHKGWLPRIISMLGLL